MKLQDQIETANQDTEKSTIVQVHDNLENMREAFARMSERVQRKWRTSVRGKGIIAKADKYNIPYNKTVTDWLGLEDLIEEWETLLEEAGSCNIWWDPFEYDPIGLTQAIEAKESEIRKRDNQMWWYHMSARI
jgi:hypothetical protein